MKHTLYLLASAFILSIPTFSFAHTKWFAPQHLDAYTTSEPTGLYLAIWALIGISIIAVGAELERRKILRLNFLMPQGPHVFERAASTFAMLSGAFFLIAGTHGYLFSPNLTELKIPEWLILIQATIGLTFLIGFHARIGAIALALTWSLGFFYVPAIELFENIWVLSTACFIFVYGSDYFVHVANKELTTYARRFQDLGFSILRIGTGVTLVILGFSEKILHPEYGINFLHIHEWNFMPLIGFTQYSDYLFTLSAGATEVLFGVVFILGIMTRLNALVVAIFFTIPLFILGPIELTGHLPHFAAVVLILLFGAGKHFRLHGDTYTV